MPGQRGYKTGDILAFTGRARNVGSAALAKVHLRGPGTGPFLAADLLPGQEALYFSPTYTVTGNDLEEDRFELHFTITACKEGGLVQASQTFTFLRDFGAVSITATSSDPAPVHRPAAAAENGRRTD